MKKRIKSMLRVFLWIAAIIVILICICFGYHRYRLRKEEKLREPLGQLIDINENNIIINCLMKHGNDIMQNRNGKIA